jgi:hypothetical protein
MLREGHRLRVSEKRVLRRIFGTKRDEVKRGRKNCTVRNVIIFTLRKTLLG